MDKQIKDYTLEKDDKSKVEEKEESKGMPVYFDKLDLSDEQKKRLVEEIFEEFEEIKKERDDIKLDERIEALDNQYYGIVQEDTRLQFNLNRNITKPVVDRVSNFIKQAFFKSNPKYSISPRPEYARQSGNELCNKQQDFLDYQIDNLPFEPAEGRSIFHGTLLGTGITKIFHEVELADRKREEFYSGEKTVVGVNNDGTPVIKIQGLEEFLRNWPNAHTDYPKFVEDLLQGKDISFIATYKETVFNDPLPKNISLKNFYVRVNTEGYRGLKTTRTIIERENYTYWKLKKDEKKGKFQDVDKLIHEENDQSKKIKNYASSSFDILECTHHFRLKEGDEEEIKIICWIEESKKEVIGSIYYPNMLVDCNYVPHYISCIKSGFYQPGLAEFVTDSNIAQSAILNLALGGVYIRNTVTPIVPYESEINNQFLEKRWTHGIPLNGKPGEVDFLQKYMPSIDISGMLYLSQFMKNDAEEISRSRSLMSGGEAPFDPKAPASKTLALLKQAGIDIEDYIMAITPAFNEIGYILLNMYYQISKEGRKYKVNSDRVVGEDVFGTIDRNELSARTNIECQAYAFDFDKLQAKQDDYALYQAIRGEPLVTRNPEAVYYILKTIISNWSPKWRNIIDKILPPLQQFIQQQNKIALQAVAGYIDQKAKESKMTGIPLELNAEELLPLVNELMAQSTTPAPEEEKNV